MPAGGGDFQGALGAFLTLDVGKIERHVIELADFRLRTGEHLRPAEVIGELDERCGGDDLHVGARPGRFRPAGRRTDQALAAAIGAHRGRQHAGNGGDRAVEPKLAQNGKAIQGVMRDGADRRHQPERDWKVVMAAFLRQIGGREIDGDAARRQRQPGCDQRRAYALARLGNGLVGQAYDVESGQAGRDLHLHVDGAGLDALERNRADALNHGRPALGS